MSAVDIPTSLTVRAYALHAEQRDEEAVNCLRHVLNLEPKMVAALYLKGLIALSHGYYDVGFRLFELRNTRLDVGPAARKYRNSPRWDGKPTSQRLLIWSEEGLGDAVQMLRFLPEVRRLCPNVTLEVPASMLRLCRGNDLAPLVVEQGSNAAQGFDVQCALLSLPGTLGAKDFGGAPYLKSPDWLVKRWRAINLERLRVGLCWQGNPTNKFRSAGWIDSKVIHDWSEGRDFVSLNRQDAGFIDVADMAALIETLDLVITVDTLQAHLAGALGKPVWVMLSADCDWRWMQKRTDSPWYKSARLFRQPVPGDWESVLSEVKTELEKHDARQAVVAQ
jgi:hypothetical protein